MFLCEICNKTTHIPVAAVADGLLDAAAEEEAAAAHERGRRTVPREVGAARRIVTVSMAVLNQFADFKYEFGGFLCTNKLFL